MPARERGERRGFDAERFVGSEIDARVGMPETLGGLFVQGVDEIRCNACRAALPA